MEPSLLYKIILLILSLKPKPIAIIKPDISGAYVQLSRDIQNSIYIEWTTTILYATKLGFEAYAFMHTHSHTGQILDAM